MRANTLWNNYKLSNLSFTVNTSTLKLNSTKCHFCAAIIVIIIVHEVHDKYKHEKKQKRKAKQA